MNADTAEDYTQPFYIPIGRGKLNLHTGIRGGYYLPALEPKPIKEEMFKSPEAERVGFSRLSIEIAQLRAFTAYLQKKLNEHKDASKKKRTEEYKINI